MPDGSIHP